MALATAEGATALYWKLRQSISFLLEEKKPEEIA